ncbi:hypothetical protein K8T06_00010 [bacterium]|nr:hypothetical protein [bacterium]
MADKTHTRRTRNLVDHRIQLGFARIIISYLTLYTVFLVLMFALPIGYIMRSIDGSESERMEAVGRFILGDSTFWGLLIVFIIVIAIHSIIMTQRYAGPIFVFRRHITRLKNGELSRMHLRQKDHLQDIVDMINEHIDQLGEHMISLGSCIDSLESIMATMETNGIETNDLAKELNRLKELKEKGWHYSA